MKGDWELLRKTFCLTFFPTSQVVQCRREIINFEQRNNEPLGAAWARFTEIVNSDPDLNIAEPVLLQHFHAGLRPESKTFLDSSSGGSFSHLTPSECKAILAKILENTPHTGVYDELPDEEETLQEEPKPDTLLEPRTKKEESTHIESKSIDISSSFTTTTLLSKPKSTKEELVRSESNPIDTPPSTSTI